MTGDPILTGSVPKRFWYALYTRPRFERKVWSLLQEKQLCAFLPEREVLHLWSNNRKRRIREPLFPSYVFIHATPKERYDGVCTNGVATIVGIKGKPSRIPEGQIDAIHRILEHGYDPEPHQYLNEGDMVQITHGPLKGLTGILAQIKDTTKLVVSVDMICRSVAITIERGQVRKVRPKS